MSGREFFGVVAPCGEGVFFDNEKDAKWTKTGKGFGASGFGVPTLGEEFREIYGDEKLKLIKLREVQE